MKNAEHEACPRCGCNVWSNVNDDDFDNLMLIGNPAWVECSVCATEYLHTAVAEGLGHHQDQ